MSNTAGPREIRSLEVDGRSSGNPIDVVSQLYDDRLDVAIIRAALSLDRDDEDPQITELIGRFAGGRPVETAKAADGRHHDPQALYDEIAPILDTRTLISYVIVPPRPEAGGELCVYAVTPDTPDPPKLTNGFIWDLVAVERRYHFQRFVLDVGDLLLLASGRCLHRIAPIVGSRARVSMGGFLALNKARDRVFYWS